MYSSPAAATAAARNGWGSIGSRMSRITSHPARFRAARWASVGWPPVTTPGIGSHALATPAAASSSWLMGWPGLAYRQNVAHSVRYAFRAVTLAAPPPRPPPEAVAQLGRCVPDGPALSPLPRRGRSHWDDPGGWAGGGLELPHLPEPHPPDGARARRQGAGDHARGLEPGRRPAHPRGPPAAPAVRALAARSRAPQSHGISQAAASIGTSLPIEARADSFSPPRALQLVPRRVGARCAPHHGRARSDAGGRIGHAKDLRLHPASLPGRGRLRHVPAAAREVRARRVAHALGILPRPSGDADHGRAGHAARDPAHGVDHRSLRAANAPAVERHRGAVPRPLRPGIAAQLRDSRDD